MNKMILALACIGVTGIAMSAQAQTIRLSDVPPGAIHTPGIGPGYIYPAYPMATIDAGDTLSSTAMMPGTTTPVDDMPAMGMGEAQVRAQLRQQGFTNVSNLRQGADGTWRGMVLQRGGMSAVTVTADGAVSLQQ